MSNHFIQATANLRPYVDGMAVDFRAGNVLGSQRTGKQDWIADTTQDGYLAMVFAADAWTIATSRIFGINHGGTSWALGFSASLTNFLFHYQKTNNSQGQISTALPSIGDLHLAEIEKDGGNIATWVDGVSAGTASDARSAVLIAASNDIPIALGSRQYNTYLNPFDGKAYLALGSTIIPNASWRAELYDWCNTNLGMSL